LRFSVKASKSASTGANKDFTEVIDRAAQRRVYESLHTF
jgi:hypothetical protein